MQINRNGNYLGTTNKAKPWKASDKNKPQDKKSAYASGLWTMIDILRTRPSSSSSSTSSSSNCISSCDSCSGSSKLHIIFLILIILIILCWSRSSQRNQNHSNISILHSGVSFPLLSLGLLLLWLNGRTGKVWSFMETLTLKSPSVLSSPTLFLSLYSSLSLSLSLSVFIRFLFYAFFFFLKSLHPC